MTRVTLPDDLYARLLGLRTALRKFERWSAEQARLAGLTPAQHQLLLAIRGHHDPTGPTIGEVADYLLLQHHSVVGLVDRAEGAGLVGRTRDDDDRRVVRLHLTPEGAERLAALSAAHLEELARLHLEIPALSEGLAPTHQAHGLAASRRQLPIAVARVTDGAGSGDGTYQVLVDRTWPPDVRKDDPRYSAWVKTIAPSAALLRWYANRQDRFDAFADRYREELASPEAKQLLHELRLWAEADGLVLVTGAEDLAHSPAAVLAQALGG